MPWPVDTVETFGLASPVGRLRAALARPRPRRARGTLLLLQGRGEFLEKYGATVERAVAEGLCVLGLDWRGQGGSPRLVPGTRRGHVDDFEDYLADLDLLVARAEALGLPEPLVLLGHSMGGHIGLRWLRRHPGHIARAALVTPMFDIELGGLPRPLVRMLVGGALGLGAARRYAPGQRDPRASCRFEGNPLTSCPEGFAQWWELLARHPDRRVGGVTWGWLAAALRSIETTRAPGFLEAIETPLLLIRAGDERIVCNRAIERFARRLPRAELLDLPGARHAVFFERPEIRAAMLERITRFLGGATPRPIAARPVPEPPPRPRLRASAG
ncbi:MAG: alpha/beta hydrolase [Geminicoccaceae bacterium]|nr:alpha/beta hydrolase [Geminicoccaceae bacterium]MCX8099792.1 alpha/beta hydrolase [Geminicoccaceae bacterium]MDW8368788.1 alpha/beta hydrolase [Geminicoccaceae bacterium]